MRRKTNYKHQPISRLTRGVKKNSEKLPGSIYFQKNCACAAQVNMVNTTTKQFFDGEEDLTVETLNEKYKQDPQLSHRKSTMRVHGRCNCLFGIRRTKDLINFENNCHSKISFSATGS